MPSEQNRVYIENEDEAPDDAIIRRGDDGSLYYAPSERGRNHHTGGDKTNDLLEQQDDDPCRDGYVMVGTKIEDGEEVPNCVPEEEAKEARELASAQGTFGKPFEGPEGQGPFDSLEDCAERMEGNVDDPEGWCAWAENKFRKENEATKIYIGSEEEAPDGVTIKEDDQGLFYRQMTAWESRDLHYPEDVEEDAEEETDVEMPESEGATEEGLESEEEYDEEQDELHDESHDRYEMDAESA